MREISRFLCAPIIGDRCAKSEGARPPCKHAAYFVSTGVIAACPAAITSRVRGLPRAPPLTSFIPYSIKRSSWFYDGAAYAASLQSAATHCWRRNKPVVKFASGSDSMKANPDGTCTSVRLPAFFARRLPRARCS